MPTKYIYEPWKAPVQDQRRAGVRVMGDGKADEQGVYPKPMFDFAERRAVCLEGMKRAYAVGLYGDDPRVIDGTWRALFPDEAERPTDGQAFPDAMLGKGAENSAHVNERVQRRPDAKGGDGAVPAGGAEAAEVGGEGKGGDRGKGEKKRTMRTGVQGTLDMHVVKRTKK